MIAQRLTASLTDAECRAVTGLMFAAVERSLDQLQRTENKTASANALLRDVSEVVKTAEVWIKEKAETPVKTTGTGLQAGCGVSRPPHTPAGHSMTVMKGM